MAQGLEDLLALGASGDCAYDRPRIGASYALWYRGARTHEAIRALAPWLSASTEPLRIVDVGCGTEATPCAVAVLMAAQADVGAARPSRVVVQAVDSSPFMVAVAMRIFDELRSLIGHRRMAAVDVSFQTSSWTDVRLLDSELSPLVVGGHLFDHSHSRHVEEFAKRFVRLDDELEARAAILFTAPGEEPATGARRREAGVVGVRASGRRARLARLVRTASTLPRSAVPLARPG